MMSIFWLHWIINTSHFFSIQFFIGFSPLLILWFSITDFLILLPIAFSHKTIWLLTKVRNKVLESRGAILSLIGRGVEIVWNLGFYWSTLMYDFLVGRDEEVVPFRARQLRNLLCDLGPSFIKAGQVFIFFSRLDNNCDSDPNGTFTYFYCFYDLATFLDGLLL